MTDAATDRALVPLGRTSWRCRFCGHDKPLEAYKATKRSGRRHAGCIACHRAGQRGR